MEITKEQISKVKVTKTLLAHLLGQIFDLSGLLTPVRAALLSLFSKVCLLLKDWSTPSPADSEVATAVLTI